MGLASLGLSSCRVVPLVPPSKVNLDKQEDTGYREIPAPGMCRLV
jgi:hypothetical protein